MSSSTELPSADLSREDISNKCSQHECLTKDWVSKGFSDLGAPPPDSKSELESRMSDYINKTLANITSDYSADSIADIVKLTFVISSLQEEVADRTGSDATNLRQEFYGKMSEPEVVITHKRERSYYSRKDPLVEDVTEFLLDEEASGGNIPDLVKSRAGTDWSAAKKKAKKWAVESNFDEIEACEEIIPALMAVEVHTGGNPDHTGPYERYLKSQFSEIVTKLREVGALEDDDVPEILNQVLRNESEE